MYLTAQRIRTVGGREEGINVLMYRHGGDIGAVNWEDPDFEELTTRNPGDLVARSTPIRPGGNHVLSFLDVLAPETATEDDLRDALGNLSVTMPLEARRWRGRSERVSARFLAELSTKPPMSDFAELSERAIQLFHARPPMQEEAGPLLIRCSMTDEKTTFTLDDPSRRRLLDGGAPRWLPSSLSLDHAVGADLADVHPNYLRDVALVLTGLDEDALARIGGVRLADANGKEWLVWPGPGPIREEAMRVLRSIPESSQVDVYRGAAGICRGRFAGIDAAGLAFRVVTPPAVVKAFPVAGVERVHPKPDGSWVIEMDRPYP